ncbi:endonuclease/exonuclease/phosphatase family protein [Actinacidiphila glaucinigra]|nr:endonuclease/exonuclease/phosphatase family protein [Actinacidiphila glaucinigra]WSD65644.1 endonuclease/exonuclease/phosphatase family protein [Actinacidiphila glaucinigra]
MGRKDHGQAVHGWEGAARNGRGWRGRRRWDGVLAALPLLLALLLVCHTAVPNGPGRWGSLLETFLPWLGLGVPVVLCVALLRRSGVALCALLVPSAAWFAVFGWLPDPQGGSAYDLVAVQHNVSDVNADPRGTARQLAAADGDLIALQELAPSLLPEFGAVLDASYPHHVSFGTVGLWSRYPLADERRIGIRPTDLGEDWDRGFRATARTPQGDVAVYVAHLPSLRLGRAGFGSARRDESAALLGAEIAAEPLDPVILLGDLNGTLDDRGLAPLTSRLGVPERGLAFSWPERFPLARIDQVLARSATVSDVRTLPATGSDHLPVAARIRF